MSPASSRRFFGGALAALLIALLPAGTGARLQPATTGASHAGAAHVSQGSSAVLASRADEAASVARATKDRAPLSTETANLAGRTAVASLRALGTAPAVAVGNPAGALTSAATSRAPPV